MILTRAFVRGFPSSLFRNKFLLSSVYQLLDSPAFDDRSLKKDCKHA
jgi:hypothetical protein